MAQQERLPDGLSYDCKQRTGGKRRQSVSWGLLLLAHLPAHLMWSFLSSKAFHSSFSKDNLTWLKALKPTWPVTTHSVYLIRCLLLNGLSVVACNI